MKRKPKNHLEAFAGTNDSVSFEGGFLVVSGAGDVHLRSSKSP